MSEKMLKQRRKNINIFRRNIFIFLVILFPQQYDNDKLINIQTKRGMPPLVVRARH